MLKLAVPGRDADRDSVLNGNSMVSQLLKSRLPRKEPSEVEGGRIVGCGYFPPCAVGCAWGRGSASS